MPNAYFYKMRLFEEVLVRRNGEQDTLQYNYFPKEELETRIKRIVTRRDDNSCIAVDDAPAWVVVEILSYNRIENFGIEAAPECGLTDADYIFGRIGKKKDITNYQKRNRMTMQAEDIAIDPDQDFEVHTYFYLFFDNAIIVYLGAQSAPGITKLNDMFSRHNVNETFKTEIVPVTAEDMIQILEHKDIVSSFEITVSIPSDQILTIDNLNLGETIYDAIRENVNTSITITFTAERRNQNLFRERNNIGQVIERLTSRINGRINKMRFKAKNHNERTHEYDIIEKRFTKNISFNYENDVEGRNRRIEIERTLIQLYVDNRTDIIRYCRD